MGHDQRTISAIRIIALVAKKVKISLEKLGVVNQTKQPITDKRYIP